MVEERNRSEFRFVSIGFPDKTGIGHIVDSDVVSGICAAGNVNRKAPAPKGFSSWWLRKPSMDLTNPVQMKWLVKWQRTFLSWLRIAITFLDNDALFIIIIAVWIWSVVFLHQIAIGKDFYFKTMLFHPELNELRFIHSPETFQIKSEFGEGNGRT